MTFTEWWNKWHKPSANRDWRLGLYVRALTEEQIRAIVREELERVKITAKRNKADPA